MVRGRGGRGGACVLTTVADSASAVLAQAKFEEMELKILWAQIQQGASAKASGCSTRADTRIHTRTWRMCPPSRPPDASRKRREPCPKQPESSVTRHRRCRADSRLESRVTSHEDSHLVCVACCKADDAAAGRGRALGVKRTQTQAIVRAQARTHAHTRTHA